MQETTHDASLHMHMQESPDLLACASKTTDISQLEILVSSRGTRKSLIMGAAFMIMSLHKQTLPVCNFLFKCMVNADVC